MSDKITSAMITLNSENIKKVAEKAKNAGVNLYSEMSGPSTKARTEKGAKSYSVSGDPRVDLFFKSVRGMPCASPEKPADAYLESLLEECWKVSPMDTLKLGFYIRDCRGGKGEKALFWAFCWWLLRSHPSELGTNIQHVPFFGSWKDLLRVFSGTLSEEIMVKLYTSQLKSDVALLGSGHENNITLAAKYAPSEKGAFDRKFTAVTKFCNELGVNKATYRRKYLRPLRAKINTVEEMMCAGRWGEIDYSKVPSVASGRYRKAFTKHDPKRYQEFLCRVTKGEAKMNTGVLHPHEIAKAYISGASHVLTKIEPTAEAQWAQFVKDQRARRAKLENPVEMLAIVDVSGSMYGPYGASVTPIAVSLSLGVLIAELNSKESPFYRKWITFSRSPKMETLKGNTLCEIFQRMDKCHWDMSTRLQPVFDMILTAASAFSVPPEKMPKMLVILSDMQFDAACPDRTNWEEIDRKYREAGYNRPVIVFWNLRGDTLDFPVTDKVSGTALVSGFSASTLSLLMDGNVPNPYQVMRKAIDNPRYERITLPPPPVEWVLEDGASGSSEKGSDSEEPSKSTPIKEIIEKHMKNVQT